MKTFYTQALEEDYDNVRQPDYVDTISIYREASGDVMRHWELIGPSDKKNQEAHYDTIIEYQIFQGNNH